MRASLAFPDSKQRSLRLLPGPSDLARDVAHFLHDRQARGLSPRTVDFHAEKLRHLTRWLDGQGVARVEGIWRENRRHSSSRAAWREALEQTGCPLGRHICFDVLRQPANGIGLCCLTGGEHETSTDDPASCDFPSRVGWSRGHSGLHTIADRTSRTQCRLLDLVRSVHIPSWLRGHQLPILGDGRMRVYPKPSSEGSLHCGCPSRMLGPALQGMREVHHSMRGTLTKIIRRQAQRTVPD